MRTMIGTAVLGALAACAEAGGPLEAGAADTGTTPATASTTTSATGTTPSSTPRWYGFSAALSVQAGEVVGGAVTLAIYPEDVDQGPLCEVVREVVQAASVAPPPDPAVLGWWQVVTDGAAKGCEGAEGIGNAAYLGIGQLHPEIEVLLDAYGLADRGASLYGAYASFDVPGNTFGVEPEVWVFGYAARPQDLVSGSPAVDEPPLPDGTYDVEPVYLFDIDQSLQVDLEG